MGGPIPGLIVNERDTIWSGAVFTILGVWQTYEAANSITHDSLVPNDPMSPATIPMVLGVLTVATGVGLLVRRAVRSHLPTARQFDVDGAKRVAGGIGACLVYAFVVRRIGYAIATPLVIGALVLAASHGKIRPARTVWLAVLVPVASYLFFVLLLDVDLSVLPT